MLYAALRTLLLRTSWSRLDRLLARDHPASATKAALPPTFTRSDARGPSCLLHGMSSTPAQFERFAHELFARGHNVLVPRLPAHGHSDRLSPALADLRPDDLYSAVDEYVAIARELGERVTVAGFSLGGLLAAWTAQHYALDRCVAIAPFFGVAWIPSPLMPHSCRGAAARSEPVCVVESASARTADARARLSALHDSRYRPRPSNGPRYCARTGAGPSAQTRRDRREPARSRRRQPRDPAALRRWRKRWPAAVEMSSITGLPLSHDIVEPLRRGNLAARAFPQLLAAIDPNPPSS